MVGETCGLFSPNWSGLEDQNSTVHQVPSCPSGQKYAYHILDTVGSASPPNNTSSRHLDGSVRE